MYKAFFAGMETNAPIYAMGLFIAMFLLMLLRTLVYKKKSDFESVAALPLADERSSKPGNSDEVQP
jgi:hypothetical protein